jgi:AcrR family transcriptional regulator
MPTRQPKPSTGPAVPHRGVRAATYRLLIDTAISMIRAQGHVPSMAEVAQRCGISRATAYRYFPTRGALVAAVVDNSLDPVRGFESAFEDGPRRVREVFERTFPRFQEFEAQMRAAVQVSLEQWAQERAGTLSEEPYRRGHRVAILGKAIEPMARDLAPATHLRLHQALSVVYGIESWMVLKDIWGLSDRAVERVALWMADAMVAAALAESPNPRSTERRQADTADPPSPVRATVPASPSATASKVPRKARQPVKADGKRVETAGSPKAAKPASGS